MKIGILCTQIYDKAIQTKNELIKKYNFVDILNEEKINNIDLFIVLGGDGFMLRSIHKYYMYKIPFFGINYGNVGFLLNDKNCLENDLIDIISNAQKVTINPLNNTITDINNNTYNSISINELTLMRSVYKTCDIDIYINYEKKVNNYSGDGLVVSTPIGSSAYNSSLGGPIINYNSNSIILSTISPFRPRTLRNVILQNNFNLKFDINYSTVRKVSAFADFIEYKNIVCAETSINKELDINIMFNKNKTLDTKIIDEQFNNL